MTLIHERSRSLAETAEADAKGSSRSAGTSEKKPTEPAVGPATDDAESTFEGQTPKSISAGAIRPGVELVGRYRGSGRTTDRFLARRPDGQWVELTPLLFLVAAALDGSASREAIARTVSKQIDRELSAENVDYLLTEKLSPIGLLDNDDPRYVPGAPKLLLALRAKRKFLPARIVRAIARVLRHLFHAPLTLILVGAFIAIEVHIFASGLVAHSANQILAHPQWGLIVLGIILASTLFHEFGHASACAYGGAMPGEIGAGFYLAWPCFYTDVTDGYRLNRSGRVRTDLGGVYFNAIFAVAVYGLYELVGFVPLLLVVASTIILIAEQLMPFVRFDGYWVISDLAGVPDLFPRWVSALRRVVHPRARNPRMEELRPYARRVIMIWAVIASIVLPLEFFLGMLMDPSIAASSWFSFLSHLQRFRIDVHRGDIGSASLEVLQVLVLAIAVIGLVYAVCFLSYRAIRFAVRRWGHTTLRKLTVGFLAATALSSPMLYSATQIRLIHST